MLNEADIEWIKGNRAEVTGNRQTLITIAYRSEGTVDEISGELTDGELIEREVMSVVTEIATTNSRDFDRILINGIAVEMGDVWLSIAYDLITDIADKLESIYYDNQWYAIMAIDKKGIGVPNRVEIVGRVTT